MVLDSYLLNPLGLYAALALVPFLLLYLIRPQPGRRTIPSLMFLLRDRDKTKRAAWLRSFLRQFLFIVQFLILAALVLAVAKPFISVSSQVALSETIIVLDHSASMYAVDAGVSRHDAARDFVLGQLGKQNTIILAGSMPQLLIENAPFEDAALALREWRPSHEPTRLTGALLVARDYATPDSRVLVVSDFIDTDPDLDYYDAFQTVRATGASVFRHQVGVPGASTDNIGIVDVLVGQSRTTVDVHNYRSQGVTTRVCAGRTCYELVLPAQSTTSYGFPTPAGVTELRVETQDAFSVDDVALISTDTNNEISVLVVTNGDWDASFLAQALASIQRTTRLTFTIEVNRPPALVTPDHDLIIFLDVDAGLLVSRTVRQAVGSVASGGAVIIMTQDDVFGVGYQELLPFTYNGSGGSSRVMNTDSSRIFAGIEYGSVTSYHRAVPEKEMQVLALAGDGTPLIALFTIGEGKVLWYGLSADDASFSYDPLFPVFWRNAVQELTGRRSVGELNHRTGEILLAPWIRTPDGESVANSVLLSEQGRYETPSGTHVANLLHVRESNVAVPVLEERGVARDVLEEEQSLPQDISWWVIVAAIVLLFLELGYIKWRGDV